MIPPQGVDPVPRPRARSGFWPALRTWLSRLGGVVRRRRDEDLTQEIETHLALMAEELERRGLSPDEARDAARRAFGGVDKTRATYRRQFGMPLIDSFVQDVRFALRLLARERGFAITAIAVLGVGIGVNNMMFTLIYGSTLRGLPITDRDRVLHISTFDQRFPDRPLSYPEFDLLRTNARTFAGLAAFVNAPVAVGDEGRAADRFDGTYLSANAFGLVGTAPVLGRGFTENDDRPGAEPVAILGAGAWQTRYGGDPAIVGRSILVDGAPVTVIGVMPAPSRFPSTAEIWLPLARRPRLDTPNSESRTLRVFGRVEDGIAVSDARAEVETLIARAADASAGGERVSGRTVPINDRFFGSPTQPAWLAFTTAGILIMIVSCANAANLMLSRTGLRSREMAVRGSLGATRGRIVCQILVESLLIAAIGGVTAAGVSLAAVRLFNSAIPAGAMPYWLDYSMDSSVLLALVVASFIAVLLVGLVPAIQASKTDVNRVLKDGGRQGRRSGGRRLATVFLAAEFAITIVLLTQFVESWRGADLDVRSDETLDTSAVLTASVTLPSVKYATPPERYAFYQRLFERLPAVGRSVAASAANVLPLRQMIEQRLDVEGAATPETEKAPTVTTVSVAPGYFDALDVPLLRGRGFAEADGLPGRESAIVNQRFVEVHLAGREPIGQRIRITAPNAAATASTPLTIVGVADNIRQRTTTGAEPIVYAPFRAATPATASILLRSRLEPSDAARLLRQEVMAIDPDLPLYRMMTMAAAIDDAQWNGRASHRLITGLTLIALCVSIIGLYAVTAHSVSQRTQELGIRIALGAQGSDVGRLILRRAVAQVGLGLIFGVAGSMLWSSAFFTGRVESNLIRPGVFLPVCALLAVVTLAACVIPLRRATSVNPVAALRDQ